MAGRAPHEPLRKWMHLNADASRRIDELRPMTGRGASADRQHTG
jgi:hypothetical protein